MKWNWIKIKIILKYLRHPIAMVNPPFCWILRAFFRWHKKEKLLTLGNWWKLAITLTIDWRASSWSDLVDKCITIKRVYEFRFKSPLRISVPHLGLSSIHWRSDNMCKLAWKNYRLKISKKLSNFIDKFFSALKFGVHVGPKVERYYYLIVAQSHCSRNNRLSRYLAAVSVINANVKLSVLLKVIPRMRKFRLRRRLINGYRCENATSGLRSWPKNRY